MPIIALKGAFSVTAGRGCTGSVCNILRGARPPVDLRAVCLVRAMTCVPCFDVLN